MIEGPRATPSEHRQLIAILIDRTIAVDTFGDDQRLPAHLARRNQLRCRLRAEAVKVRLRLRPEDLDNPHPILAIGDKGKLLGADHPDLHIAHIVQRPSGIEHLRQLRLFGLLDIDDGNPVLAGGNIRIRAGHINVAGIVDRHLRLSNRHWMIKMRHIEDFQPSAINHKGIAELNRNSPRIIQHRRANLRNDLRMQRIGQRHNLQPAIAENVGIRSRQS